MVMDNVPGILPSASFELGFGPGFFTVLFAFFLMGTSTVLCCAAGLCGWICQGGAASQQKRLIENTPKTLEVAKGAQMQVTIPPGVQPGQAFLVQLADGSQTMVTAPLGSAPGQIMLIDTAASPTTHIAP